MNKNILFVSIFCWLLMGCTSTPPKLGTSFDPSTSVVSCIPYSDTATCTGDKNNPKVIFDLDNFEFVPKCVNAKKGRRITVELTSTIEPEKGSVTVFPKDPGNYFWLAGTNYPNSKKIKIKVPKTRKSGEPFPDGIYSYGIWTEAKCLDPRVNVTN